MTHLGTIVHFEGIERYYHEAELGQELVLSLLALLVQKYKYCFTPSSARSWSSLYLLY